MIRACFSYNGKIPDDQGFYFSPTVPDFADISDNRQKSVLDSPDIEVRQKLKFVHKRVIGRLEPNSLRGLVMSEIHRRRPRWYKFEFSFVGNDHRPSQKSGTRRENRNTPLQICPRPSKRSGISTISSFH